MTLKTGEAGGPYKLDIINGNNKVSFQDVLIGDVWLAGGQSNMEFALRRVKDAQKEISSADYPQIRYYKVPRKFYPNMKCPKHHGGYVRRRQHRSFLLSLIIFPETYIKS